MFLGFIIRRYKDVCLLNIFNTKHLLLSEFQLDSSYRILMLFYALYSVLERKMTILYCLCFFHDKFYLLVDSFRWEKKVPEINISVILSLHNCFTNHTAWPPSMILHYSKIQNNIPVWQLTSGTTGLVSRCLYHWLKSW